VTATPLRIGLAFAVLLLLVSIPVFSTVLPPLFDYPNHLARMHLLAEGGNAYHAVRWAPLPNLAEDLIVPSLAQVMPLALAGKLFLVLIFGMTAGGALWLGREATGQWRWWPLLAFSLLYSRTFLWGFVNYLAGIGLALVAAALWLRLERAPAPVRVAVSILAALACYLAHIEAFGVYALVIAGVEALPALALIRSRAWAALAGRLAVAAPQFIGPAILFAFVWTPVAGGTLNFTRFWRKADLPFSVFDDYSRPFDALCFAAFCLTLLGLALMRRLNLAPRIGMAALFVTLAYLALPSQMLSGSGADHRLPLAIFLLLVAGSAPRFASLSAARWSAVAFIFIGLVRLAVIEAIWLQSDKVYAGDLAALDALPQGAKLAVAFPASAVDMARIPETHLPVLAVARREAFVPTLFAYPAQQPIALNPPFAALADAVRPEDVWAVFVELDASERARLLPLMARFDFIVFTARDFVHVPPDPCLTPVSLTATFQIYRFAYAMCSAG
jgi:hypothetical protein